MTSIRQLKKQAKEILKDHKNLSAAVAAICIYPTALINYSSKNLVSLFWRHEDLILFTSSIAIFIIGSAFSVGLAKYTLEIVKSNKSEINTFFSSFEDIFRVFMLSLLKTVFIFLWSLLFVIPGIIAAYRYSMADFILAEDPDITPLKAISLSKEMMRGKKLKFFDLNCSFIGWFLLSIITFGLSGLYSIPYERLSATYFYIDVKNEYIEEQNFRAEWNAKKCGFIKNNDFDDASEYKNEEAGQNYAWKHANGDDIDNNISDNKTYL